MRYLRFLLLVSFSCAIFCGCGAGKIEQLTAEVESLRASVEELKAENTRLESELENAKKDLAGVEEIKKGYETARTKFRENLAQLAPLLGNAAPALPPFEELKDSSWIGKFAPNAEMTSGLKDLKNLEGNLKGLLGDQGLLPGAKPKN